MIQVAINLNWMCRVLLRDEGKRIWAASFPRTTIPENGVVYMPMHDLLSVLGPHVYTGAESPFETEIIVRTDELKIASG